MMFAHIHSTKEKLYGLFNLHVQLDITIGENLWSLNLSPKEKDREFCKIHRKFMEKMKALDREYKQIYTKSIPYEELRKELEKSHNELMTLRK